jgi:hypothetical protein
MLRAALFADKTNVLRSDQASRFRDIAFAGDGLTRHFVGLRWELEEGLPTKTEYGVEHVFCVEKPCRLAAPWYPAPDAGCHAVGWLSP